jgi:ketosteroid isomerase-like protein
LWDRLLDEDGAARTLDAEFEIHEHDLPEGGVYRGPEGAKRWAATWVDAWDDWGIENEEYIDAGDRVVVVAHLWARGKGSGTPVQQRHAIVFTVREGKAVRLDYFGSKAEALEAVGLPE